jgi:hypothetical protein
MRAETKRYFHKHDIGAPTECYIVAAENPTHAQLLEKEGFERVSTKCLRRHFREMNAQIVASGRSRTVSPFRFGEIRTLPEILKDRAAIPGLERIGIDITSGPRR